MGAIQLCSDCICKAILFCWLILFSFSFHTRTILLKKLKCHLFSTNQLLGTEDIQFLPVAQEEAASLAKKAAGLHCSWTCLLRPEFLNRLI